MSLLWFRRSRANDQAQQAPPEPQAPARTPRGAVTRRVEGLLLLNLQPTDGPEQIETAPPLGKRDLLIAAVQALVPGIRFDAAGRGELVAGDHRVTVDLGPGDPVHAAVAAAEGDTGIELIRTVLHSQGWRAYVPKAGIYVAPDALDLFVRPGGTFPLQR